MELVVKKSPNTLALRSNSSTTKSSSESSQTSATVTDGATNGNPFQRHDVQEWSRLDSITGMIEHARLQRDHWTANTHNSTQQYGKIIDSRDKSAADGNIQQRHRKQLEVFQTQTPGGSLQVIRTQTITSSSSRWSSSNLTSSTSSSTGASTVLGSNLSQLISNKDGDDTTRTLNQDFENLQLALNPLDLSSQKSKASVGRSGSIGGRRPPSRPRSYIGSKTDNTLQQTSNTISSTSSSSTTSIPPTTTIHKQFENDVESSLERVSEICQKIHEETLSQNNILNGFTTKSHVETSSRTRSNSIEHLDNIDTNSDDNYLEDWKRSAKIRRSLQITKLGETTHHIPQPSRRVIDLPNNTGNVNKIKQELEKGRRLNTALRGTNVDLDALDEILKSISPVINSDKFEPPEKDTAHTGGYIKENKPVLTKRHSFITAESLQEVRGRLRRLSSPINYVYKDFETPSKQEPEPDDGIVAEENLKIDETPSTSSRVRSYVFGMETAMINGRKTGSLESRTSSKNSSINGNRTEDWYNRRKSYGFEQMHNQNDCNGLQSKVESSTDSGICRSTEITILPSTLKSEANVIRNNKSTVVNLTNSKRNDHVDPFSSRKAQEELNTVWNKIASMKIGSQNTERESITIRIPIKNDGETVNSTKIHLNSDHELKRHSIAVDESKYVTQNERFPHLRRTSLAIPDNREYFTDNTDDDFNQHGRKTKKVEFCKTEVHFAAESGRVNIVETDGKPPPTQNFRRRRRNSGGNQTLLIEDNSRNNNGLPLTHFGDIDSDKKLFYGKEIDEKYPKTFEPIEPVWDKYISNTPIKNGVDYEDEQKDSSENENTPKGILKNKPIKPKPYHLGENIEITNDSTNVTPWGVRLKPVHSSSDEAVTSTPQMWHSTVVVKNPKFKNIEEETNLTKFQKEFKQFKSSNQQSVSSSLSDDNSSDTNNCVRRPSWSVADRIKQVEDMKWTENKGYSTKINFGEIGEPTIINQNMENNNRGAPSLENTWQNHNDINTLDEMKSMPVINKALVVRFGKKSETNNNNEYLTKYIENTKTNTVNTNNSQKITKIESTTPLRKSPIVFNNIKLPRATLHSLKSTSLIMNTIQQSKQQQQQQESIATTTVVPNYQKSQTSDSISSESYHSISSTTTTDDFIIPKQLEALKKLYEDAGELSDDSERADEEVRSYMSADTEDNDKVLPILSASPLKDDASSVLSGSWSKMRAIQMSQTFKKLKSDLKPTQINNNNNNNNNNNSNNNNCSLNAIITMDNCDKKYVENNRESVNQRWTKFTSKEPSNNNSTSNTYENVKHTSKQVPTNNTRSYTIPNTEKFDGSPSSTKRHYPMKISAHKYYENTTNNLTSPSLVGLQSTTTTSQSTQSTQTSQQTIRTETNNKYFMTNGKTFEENLRKYPSEKLQNYNEIITERKSTKELNTRRSQSPTKEITYLNRRNSNKSNMTRRSSSPTNNGIRETIRLRPVPTYFGAIRSPRTPRKYSEKVNVLEKSETNNSLLTNKPDLLCHNSISTRIGSDIKTKVIKEISEDKLRRDSPIPNSEKLPSPIYANLEEIKSNKYSSRTSETIENETAILEELTRAADQILLAVNGYTDEESLKISTEDDDDDIKRKRGYERKTADVLGTISETKSWSQKTKVSEKSSVSSKVTQSTRLTKSRTPSTSSIDSINTSSKTKIVEKKEIDDQRHKRRSSNESSVKTTTRARRLQRASSREALLQSHGSSSEDIATPIVPARKPRATRRVKSAENKESNNSSLNSNSQAKRRTASSQISRTSSSKKEVDVVKKDRHSLTTGLPEIRHKTAVSTIRSSAEKQAEKEKLRRSEENRKRVSSRRDPHGSTSSSRLRSNHPTSYRGTDGHGSTYGTTNSHGIQTVPVERITTTNGNVLLNRRCSRNEALSRH